MYSIGEKVDDMIIQSYEGMTENYVKLFRVKCAICGAEKIIQYSRLNSHKCTFHNVKTCNYCHYADKNIGLTINDYTIVKRLNKQYKTSAYYLARCNVCGMEFETTIGNFKRYGTKHENCTCHIPKNENLKRFRKIYSCMRYRTTNPKYTEWYLYGGRGISSEYYADFMVFYKELFQSYLEHIEKYGIKDTTLDRIDCNGNYEKGNVRWATCKEQVLNQRRNYEKSQTYRME